MLDDLKISNNPTVILIHGSWLGGWSWRSVACLLTAEGYRVLTPTLTGLGDRKHLLTEDINLSIHIEDIVNLILYENITDVVLVGHSYGSMVAAGAADRLFSQVNCSIVIVDGFITEPGESVVDRYPNVYSLMQQFLSTNTLLVEPPPVEIFGLNDHEISAAITPFLTMMPLSTHTEKLRYSLEKQAQMSRSYICCKEFPMFHQTASEAAVQGWHSFEVNAGHMAPITHPKHVADLITAAIHS